MSILVTGGAGYVGSHICAELVRLGYHVIVIDNFSTSGPSCLKNIELLYEKTIPLYPIDLRNTPALYSVFRQHNIEAVVHCAGSKFVKESMQNPIYYYSNNVTSTISLCEVMAKCSVKRLIFSSSATVYGDTGNPPFSESSPTAPSNPYGQTKLIIERLLHEIYASDPQWGIAVLRYFNPVGAHPSELIGESPIAVPNNLMPYISQVAAGRQKQLFIFGADHPTPDGTCIRDYLHIMDLAVGHIQSLNMVMKEQGVKCYNLGTGKGYSVLEVLSAYENVSGMKIPYTFVERRAGDASVSFADPGKANAELGWKAQRSLEEMCDSAWRWQQRLTASDSRA